MAEDIEDTEAFLARMLARPMTHKVVTHFVDGRTREHLSQSLGGANNYAYGEKHKIGKKLINRETGATVEIVAVTIEAL